MTKTLFTFYKSKERSLDEMNLNEKKKGLEKCLEITSAIHSSLSTTVKKLEDLKETSDQVEGENVYSEGILRLIAIANNLRTMVSEEQTNILRRIELESQPTLKITKE